MDRRLLRHLIGLFFVVVAAPASAFEFSNLRAEVVPLSCRDEFARPRRLVRLEDEAEVVIMNWNVEGVRGKLGGVDSPGVDPRSGHYLPGERRADFAPRAWKFRAKQRKIKDAAAFAGLKPGTLAHFIVAPEVESIEAAEELFNEKALHGRYRTFLTTGNDARGGVDIAFAVRADLDVTVEMRTHRHARWYDPTERTYARLFTRDLPSLVVRDNRTKDVVLILIGQHAKSMRDRSKGRDKGSVELRSAQLKASAEIVRQYQRDFGADVPIVMAGDFNAEVRSAPEVLPIKGVLTDAFDVVGALDRTTQTYHPHDDVVIASQLDACFVSASLKPYVLRSLVLPEFDHRTGARLGLPTSRQDRDDNFSSDHRPVATVFAGRAFHRARPRPMP